ncbi:MAG: phage Gp37/Gp68 family protein [Acidimicrobiales bacterium]
MGVSTEIAWCDHTFNPWWGCTRVSPGCQNCYAEAFAKRTGHDVWGKATGRRVFGDRHWNEPRRWNAKAETEGIRRRVFCASMADVFEDHPDLEEPRERLFDLILQTPALDWLLLTKRPENIAAMLPDPDCPPANVWLGTTVEDQDHAHARIPTLLDAGYAATCLFLSCEPLLGPVDLTPWFDSGIDWVIVGGESGPRHRPFDPEWAIDIRDQCEAFGVPFFFKQHGGRTPKAGGDLLDGDRYYQFPREAA